MAIVQRVRAHRGQFLEKFFGLWKSEFTSTTFPIIPVTSQRPLYVSAPRGCPTDPPLCPALTVGHKGKKHVENTHCKTLHKIRP